MDQRLDTLVGWATQMIHRQTGFDLSDSVTPVSGDASFRRYFRMRYRDRSWILVDAPPEKEDNLSFVRIARQWRKQGVLVPDILASDMEQGFLLLEDFGDQLMWAALGLGRSAVTDQSDSLESVFCLYRRAIEQLIGIQQLDAKGLPAYDRTLLANEVHLFKHWLCEKRLGIAFTPAESDLLDQTFTQLIERALAQPQVVVHRDFHSRNLMVMPDERLGVIDFQDAVKGPITYDLVSLLRDCYVRWDDELVSELAMEYWQQARFKGVCAVPWDQFKQDFDWMGMQRHLKAAGIFARLHLRDGKDGYLKDIPNTCRYLCEVAEGYPELADFHDWMVETFMPRLEEKAALLSADTL